MSADLEAAGSALVLLRSGLMHPDNLHPDANAIVPFVDPATLDPMADDDQPGYIPTIDVIRMVRPHRELDYIRRRAAHEGYKQFGETDKDSAFDDCVAIKMACREILNANRWMLAAGAQTPAPPPC